MKFMMILISTGFLFAGTASFASGWICTNSEMDYTVKLFNSNSAPRVPALLVFSQRGSGTLLTARNERISKRLVNNGTRYSAKSDSHDPMSGSVVLFVKYREGIDAPIKAGKTVSGKLIVTNDGDSDRFDVVCERYLKN